MTGRVPLDWAILAVSLFNTILLLWLGLTVLLNAERRTWGVWLVGGGLLMGSTFFLSHSAILGLSPDYLSRGVDLWWRVGWAPAIGAPFAWYLAMLWYSGFWETRVSGREPDPGLRRRHRFWLPATAFLAVVLAGLLLLANPLPSFVQPSSLDLNATLSLGGVPFLILVYPIYSLLCISLALDALRRPGPSGRMMGDLARLQARRWLLAASLALLVVSLLVGGVMLWVISGVRQGVLSPNNALAIGWMDLLIAGLIASSVLLLGQAIVSYEVFTGKSLPRRGLARYWRRAIILAAGYSTVLAGSLALDLLPIYSLLLATLLMTVFYALLSWRSYVDRTHFMDRLRPFVASQRLYEQLLASAAQRAEGGAGETAVTPLEVDVSASFRALCGEVLGASHAYLVALGPLAPLAGPPLVYPQDYPASIPPLGELTAGLDFPQDTGIPLDTRQYGAAWAIPLWSERGLVGLMLLGEKRDGGLYTQEEFEVARAAAERLVDLRASAEMAWRLMALQRQRLANSQVLDQQARRILHDEVLPRLHGALLALSRLHAGSEGRQGAAWQPDPDTLSEALGDLAYLHRRIASLLQGMPAATRPEVTRLGLLGALRQALDEELRGAFDQVTWDIQPLAEQKAQSIPPLVAEVVFYAAREALRNAARHARRPDGSQPLCLRLGLSWEDGLQITVEDNGPGLAAHEGASSLSPGSGSGQGLALHSTMMAVVGGTLSVESVPGAYTRVLLTLPVPIL